MTTAQTDAKPRRRRWLAVAVLVLLALLLLGIIAWVALRPARRVPQPAFNAAPLGRDIPVAVLVPLSGSAPGFGIATRDGALLAVNQWNARGGVLGLKIRPVVVDSQCTPAPASTAAHTAIDQDKVHYIVGEVCSGASMAIADLADQSHVVQVSPSSTEVGLTVDESGKVKDYVYRACFVDSYQGTAGARFARQTLGARTAVIMSNKGDSYSTNLGDYFASAFTDGGGRVLARENYTAQDTDYSQALAAVATLKPDVVYVPDYYAVANQVTRQAREAGITATFLGGDGWDAPDLDLKSAAGSYFTTHFSSGDPRPEVQSFVKDYQVAYPGSTPNALAALGYDATNLLLEGIKAAGADDPTKVKDSLAKIQFNGVTGQITFDDRHNPRKPAAVMAVTSGGLVFKELVSP